MTAAKVAPWAMPKPWSSRSFGRPSCPSLLYSPHLTRSPARTAVLDGMSWTPTGEHLPRAKVASTILA